MTQAEFDRGRVVSLSYDEVAGVSSCDAVVEFNQVPDVTPGDKVKLRIDLFGAGCDGWWYVVAVHADGISLTSTGTMVRTVLRA